MTDKNEILRAATDLQVVPDRDIIDGFHDRVEEIIEEAVSLQVFEGWIQSPRGMLSEWGRTVEEKFVLSAVSCFVLKSRPNSLQNMIFLSTLASGCEFTNSIADWMRIGVVPKNEGKE